MRPTVADIDPQFAGDSASALGVASARALFRRSFKPGHDFAPRLVDPDWLTGAAIARIVTPFPRAAPLAGSVGYPNAVGAAPVSDALMPTYARAPSSRLSYAGRPMRLSGEPI